MREGEGTGGGRFTATHVAAKALMERKKQGCAVEKIVENFGK